MPKRSADKLEVVRRTVFEDTYIGHLVRQVQQEVVQPSIQPKIVLDGGQVDPSCPSKHGCPTSSYG